MKLHNEGAPLCLVDTDTGESLLTVDTGDTVTLTRAASKICFKRLREEYVPCNDGRGFVKLFPDIAGQLLHCLSAAELWLLVALLPYIGLNSGILQHPNGRFLTRGNLVEQYADIQSARTIDRALSGLLAKGVLAKCTIRNRSAYLANPYVFQRGQQANATLLSLFDPARWNGCREPTDKQSTGTNGEANGGKGGHAWKST